MQKLIYKLKIILIFFVALLYVFGFNHEELLIYKGGSGKLTNNKIFSIHYDSDCLTLDKVCDLTGIKKVWEKGYKGKDIVVAVLDSGVYPHPDLTEPENRIIAFKDLVNNISRPYDDCGHGTLISGIIAGNGYLSYGKFKGLAPDCKIIAVKVLNVGGTASVENIIKGIDWVITNKDKFHIRIINLSLAIKVNDIGTSDKLKEKAEEAVNKGIVVITSVGNKENNQISQVSPAQSRKVIAVGSVEGNNYNDYKVAAFSNHWFDTKNGTKPDMVTLGENIISLESDLWYNPAKKNGYQSEVSYIASSGTSLSGAVVSGITAVLLQQYPDMSPAGIKDLLVSYCKKLNDLQESQGNGFLYIDK